MYFINYTKEMQTWKQKEMQNLKKKKKYCKNKKIYIFLN